MSTVSIAILGNWKRTFISIVIERQRSVGWIDDILKLA